jgi:hypothetical protein
MEQLAVLAVNIMRSGFNGSGGSPKIPAIVNDERRTGQPSQKRLCIKAPLW